MGRHSTIQKNRVIIECTDDQRRVRAWVIQRNETTIKVELPSGYVMQLERRVSNNGFYRFQLGMLEFVSDGKPVT